MMESVLTRELWISSPLIALSVGALLILLLEVFFKREWERGVVTALILVVATDLLVMNFGRFEPQATAFSGLIYADGFSFFFSLLILFGSLLALLLGEKRLKEEGIEASGEYHSLLLMSTIGALIFVSAAELVTFFLGLEIMSMALYCLCGSALSSRRSTESALKYFLLGSFSSAFLLYGIALIYGLTGTTEIPKIAGAVANLDGTMLYLGMGLMLVGLAFKLGAVPFHFWAPDVYQGAPTPITAYMACVIKTAAVAGMLRVLWVAFGALFSFWSGAVWYIALFTMTVGNLVALRQRSLKRMLAYSSIAHAGYMCVALLVPSGEFGGGPAILYYLVAYTLMTMGAFAVVIAVTARSTQQKHPDDITRFNGLGYSQPVLAAIMALFMLSLAGIPPGMAGLLGKVYIFSAAVKANYVGLAVIGVLNSAVSAYYYLRVIVAMYFVEAESDAPAARPLGVPLAGVLGVCMLGVVFFGIFPGRVVESAAAVMESLRH